MGTGNREPTKSLHQRGKRGGPGDNTQATSSRLLDLRISRWNGLREDQSTGATEMVRIMTNHHVSPERPKRGQSAGVPGIASGHIRAASQQQPGEAAHTGAADPHEVNTVEVVR